MHRHTSQILLLRRQQLPRSTEQMNGAWTAAPTAKLKILLQTATAGQTEAAPVLTVHKVGRSSHTSLHSYIIRSAPAERNNSCWMELSSHTQRSNVRENTLGELYPFTCSDSVTLMQNTSTKANSHIFKRAQYSST